MNIEKARELYSAYYERVQTDASAAENDPLALVLARDPEIRADYEQFEQAMAQLDTLADEEILIPNDLHARIQARLDDDAKVIKPAASFWTSSKFAVAGLVAAGIIFATIQLRPGQSGGALQSGIGFRTSTGNVPERSVPEPMVCRSTSTGVSLEFKPSKDHLVTVTDLSTNAYKSYEMKKDVPLTIPLENATDLAVCTEIKITGEPLKIVAVPGRTKESLSAGDGTLIDFGRALAGFYGVPVVVDAKASADPIRWKFQAGTAIDAATQALTTQTQKFVVEKNADGTLHISD
ncbi:MAG: hypothetical protein JSS72_01570 [Armatimonadetes bacterium]|nr:hypothetical protein [Armatimonadota bacterium]